MRGLFCSPPARTVASTWSRVPPSSVVRGSANLVVATVTLAALGALDERARADDAPTACDFARDSSTVFAGMGELSPLPTLQVQLGIDGAMRVHRRQLAIEARAGFGWATSTSAGGDVFGARGGIAAGVAFPLQRRLVLSPMLAYDAFLLWQTSGGPTQVIQRATLELSLTILVFHHVVLDLHGQVGVGFFDNVRDLVLVGAPRVGITW